MKQELSNDEVVKWACLFECLYNVKKQCEKSKTDFDYILKKKLKPHIINQYIEQRFPIMCNQIETEQYAGEFISEFLFKGKE
jgi:hypothetical protein